jgi:hypothetical protein
MAATKVQTFENHARIIPAYHFLTFGILVFNALWCIYVAISVPSMDSLVRLLVAIALLFLFFFARVFALTVQDRVIRLEMALRLRDVLPPDLRTRVGELTVKQLVALRFASDAEMPALVATVLADGIHDQKTIKKMVRSWQADHLRA